MKEIFIILSCVPLYVVNSFCDKQISTKNKNSYNYLYNFLKFLIASICFFVICMTDDAPKFGIGTICCGLANGIMLALSKIAVLKGYEKSSVAFISLCHGAGMLIPCIIGHFFWNEKMTLASMIGILIIVVSVWLLKGSSAEKTKKIGSSLILGFFVFVLSGGIMVSQKCMGLYFKNESASAYNFYGFFVAFLILSVFVSLKSNNKLNEDKNLQIFKKGKEVFVCAIGSGVSLCIISLVMTLLAGKVPSIIMFPLFNGLGIILVCIAAAVFFKEKLTPKKIIGVLLGLGGLCLMNI